MTLPLVPPAPEAPDAAVSSSDFFGRLVRGVRRIANKVAPVLGRIARAVAPILGRRVYKCELTSMRARTPSKHTKKRRHVPALFLTAF
jgi:hypothetical protein